MSAPLDSSARNATFQPGQAKQFKVLRPAEARVLGGENRYGVKVQKITPLLSTPARVEIGRTSVRIPGDAAVRPAVTKAAGGS